jgi:fatty acid desaturase
MSPTVSAPVVEPSTVPAREPVAARRGSDYAELSRRVRAAGLLDYRRGYTLGALALPVLLLVAGWSLFAVLGDSWWQLGAAALLGIAFTQGGFVGHEAGHRQLFATKQGNDIAGLIFGNLGIGLSYGWWIAKHNKHHAHPNQVGKDPDIAVGALVFTADDARERRWRRGLTGFVTRHQAALFFPMLLLEGFNLHVAAVRALRAGDCARPANRRLEAGLLLAHGIIYLSLVFWLLSPLHAIVFVLVQQAIFGFYMGCSFAPNHKGMEMLEEDQRVDFLRAQVLTSRNVRGGMLTNLAFGGLNYQIEHHLFPSMQLNALPKARLIVRDYCAELDLPYTETGLIQSYRLALRHLREVSAG